MAENRNEDWKKDPKLEDIDAAKLDMLQKLAEKGSGKSASDMLPFLMSAAASGKKNGLNFSQNGNLCRSRSDEDRKISAGNSQN